MSDPKPHTLKTSPEGTVKKITKKGKPEVYFHPGSGTLLFVDAEDNLALQEENNFLCSLLEEQMRAKEAVTIAEQRYYSPISSQTPQYTAQLDKAYERHNKSANALRNALDKLTPAVHEGQLLDDSTTSSAIGLMELLPLGGNTRGMKFTYARSDKIKAGLRKYKMSQVDNKRGEGSFMRYKDVKVVDKQASEATGKTQYKTVRQGSIDTNRLMKQFKDASVKVKLHEWMPQESTILSDWAKEMNKALIWPSVQGDEEEKKIQEEGFYSGYVDIGAQAQLMRFSRGAGAEAEFNPLSGKVKVGASGNASFSLGEAKAELILYPLGKVGVILTFPARDGNVCDMGAIRMTLGLHLTGSVGASIAVEAGVLLDWSGDMAKGYGIKGQKASLKRTDPAGPRKINLAIPPMPSAQVGGELGAFAGAQAGGNLSAALQWRDPFPDETPIVTRTANELLTDAEKGENFQDLAVLKLGVNAQAGVGGSGVAYVTYINGRFRARLAASLCWGVGAKGSLGFEIDGPHVYQFIKCFMFMLRNADYQKLDKIMEPDAFTALATLPLLSIVKAVQIGNIILNNVDEITRNFITELKNANNRVKLMESILANPDQLKYTPPETKGAVIAQLIDTTWIDRNDLRNQNNSLFELNAYKIGGLKKRKQAIFKALTWVQSKADYRNIMQHLTITPGAGAGDWEANQQKVLQFMSIQEWDVLAPISTNYEQKFREFYRNLSETTDSRQPFRPVSTKSMDYYLAMVDQQHSDSKIYHV